MERGEALNSSLSAVQSIPDEDLDGLLEFTQKANPRKDDDIDDFQYHQVIEVPQNTIDLFRDEDDDGKELTHDENTQKYPPEFDLSFPVRTPDPTLILNTQKTDIVDISCTTLAQNNFEESVFVHPRMKHEPLDLSVPSLQFSFSTSSKLENKANDEELDLEFSANPVEENDKYLISPSTSRKSPIDSISQSRNHAIQEEENTIAIQPSTSRSSHIERLTQSYSQTSLEEERLTAITRTELCSSQNAQHDLTHIPKSVQRIYETIKTEYSDFAFIYSLASQLCQERVPMDCFVHLKIGLLLSIASLEDNLDRPPISIVAIGQEFAMANLLMETIGNVAERFVGPDDTYKPPTIKKNALNWIEADPIVMAKGGIFYLGDWGRLSSSRSFKMFKIIECGNVLLERTSINCPLEAAIWTHWRSYKFDTKDQHTLSKFVEIFGVPLIIEDENHETLVDFILEQASEKPFESTVDELSINSDEMRDFLSIVSKRKVDLTDEASELLRKYFVTSRIDRPDCLSQRSFTTLKLFAESFAKLSLRHEVIMIDAISAIYMTENFIQNIFGPGYYPPPKFKTHSYISAVDEHMMKFQEWVNNYISQFLDKDIC